MFERLKNNEWVMYGVAGLLALALLVAGWFYLYPPDDDSSNPENPTGSLLLDVADDASADDMRRIHDELHSILGDDGLHDLESCANRGVQVTELHEEANLFRINNPPANLFDEIVDALEDDSAVESIEIEGTFSIPQNEVRMAVVSSLTTQDSVRPNDPLYRHQWHMDQIQMPEAWADANGGGTVVAVIDTGVAYGDEYPQAPDLAMTCFVPGWDFIDNDEHADDENGHGTHCAGTVAQSTNNGLGVTGVAPGVCIMPVRVLDARGSGGFGGVAAGIRWAADHGANIISMSLGSSHNSSAVQAAINHAHANGVTVVAACGNSNIARCDYPGANDNVIAVGATNFHRTRAWYSSYGDNLDIVAPGGDTRRDDNNDGVPDGVLQNTIARGNPEEFEYAAYQGTSMATPHAAAVAALIYEAGVHDPDTIESVLVETAADLGDEVQYSAGLIQAHDAIMLARDLANDEQNVDMQDLAEASTILGGLSMFPYLLLIGLTLHVKGWRKYLSKIGYVLSAMSICGIVGLSFYNFSVAENVMGALWLALSALGNLYLARQIGKFSREV